MITYKELYEYNHHSNQKLIDLFLENPNKVSEKSVKLLSHILNAHHNWNNRINKQEEPFGTFQIHPPDMLKQIDSNNHALSLLIIDTVEYTRPIGYVNSQGHAYTNSVKDVLFHVINHSTYHRGQIASDLRANNIDPVVTDYVAYTR